MLHFEKTGIRILGIAESYRGGKKQSLICGIVMRRDKIIDGCAFSHATVGGAWTQPLPSLPCGTVWHETTSRPSCWAAASSPGSMSSTSNSCTNRPGSPVISVTYEDSPGLEGDIRHHFPRRRTETRSIRIVRKTNPPANFPPERPSTCAWQASPLADAVRACTIFTAQGKIPRTRPRGPYRCTGGPSPARPRPGVYFNRLKLNRISSKLNSSAGPHPGRIVMLYLLHLGDQVCSSINTEGAYLPVQITSTCGALPRRAAITSERSNNP